MKSTNKIAVQIGTNIEHFNIVQKFVERNSPYSYPQNSYEEQFCIDLNDGCWECKNYYKAEKYKIISFQEFEIEYLNKTIVYEIY